MLAQRYTALREVVHCEGVRVELHELRMMVHSHVERVLTREQVEGTLARNHVQGLMALGYAMRVPNRRHVRMDRIGEHDLGVLDWRRLYRMAFPQGVVLVVAVELLRVIDAIEDALQLVRVVQEIRERPRIRGPVVITTGE